VRQIPPGPVVQTRGAKRSPRKGIPMKIKSKVKSGGGWNFSG
jgi:hypothetical protein